MSKHNYTNYSKPETVTASVAEAPITEEAPVVEEPVVTEETAVEESVAEEVVTEETAVEEEPVVTVNETVGTVVDCKKLRVRKNPNKLADVLCEINVGSKLKIDLDNSTVEYYKVCTEAGVEGYCMKTFVTVA